MKYLSLVGITAAALLFSGCSSKQYFEPENTYSASSASSSYGGSIMDITRDGATLDNAHYIGEKGISALNIGEGFRFLSESGSYILASDVEGNLKIIDKGTKETVSLVAMHVPVVSATVQGGKIAYILNNNTFGIYEIAGNKKIVESRSEQSMAIDTRAASPIFIDQIAVFPMLDGKLIIVNSADVANAKVVYVSVADVFNNVIYLGRSGDTLIAATPKSLMTLGDAGKAEYSANISEVSVDGNNVYLFTKQGDITKFDLALNAVNTTKFKFAHYSVATAFGGKVYALDQQGSLIVLNSDLSKNKIYDLGTVDKPAFISGTKLYKDGDVVELSKLGYE